MTSHVGVLGPGAVGGTLAVRLAHGGCAVTCVARPDTVHVIGEHGLELLLPDGAMVRAAPAAVEMLREHIDVLFVTTKAHTLDDALGRIDADALEHAVVVPLLNGLEHPARIRAALGQRVAVGSISRFEARVVSPGRIEQLSGAGIVTLASSDVEETALERVATILRAGGLEAVVADDERRVLWDKAARLAVLAAATAATGLAVGELRQAPWRAQLEAALAEACSVAHFEGIEMTAAAQWAIIDAMPATLTTSTARDVGAGRVSELDAITGGVLRAAAHVGVACPELEALHALAQARAS